MPKPGLFCLEGDWYRDLRDSVTVEPILQLLRSVGVADYIHRDIGTRAEFEHYVSQWAMRRYSNYRVLYIATHGDIDTLAMGFGRRNEITLDELQDLLAGECADRFIYFGACSVFNGEEDWLTEFAQATKAKAIIGYSGSPPMLECAAFEAMLLAEVLSWSRTDAFVTAMSRRYGTQAKEFGLMAATSRRVYRAA